MHACNAVTLNQLLSVRDGEPLEAYVVQHVNTCAACADELQRLRDVQVALQSMPTLVALPYIEEIYAPKPQSKSPTFRVAGIAAAAASVSVIAILVTLARHTDRQLDDSNEFASPQILINQDGINQAGTNVDSAEPAIAALVIRSQDLESRLQRMPSRPLVERASTTSAIDSLQSSIQWVDYKLSVANDAGISASQAEQLWQDRIQLMDSLVKVRYAETQRFAVLQ